MAQEETTMTQEETTTPARQPMATPQQDTATSKGSRKAPGGVFSILFRLLHSDGEDDNALKQWKSVRRQLSIDGKWFKKQIGVLVLAVLGIVCYITCRFQAQQELILIEQLQQERTDWSYRSLTRSSELTLKTRQSLVEKELKNFGDSTLKASVQPPIITTTNKK